MSQVREPVLKRYSLEVTPRDADAFHAVGRLLPHGSEVFVAELPHQEPELLLDAAVRYRRAGFRPVPHLVARNILGAGELATLLSKLAREAAVDRVLVLGGDRDEPVGPFSEALDLIDAGRLQEHGITSVAFACFPEGHPRIPDVALQEALEAKLAAAGQGGLDVLLISQFVFDADPLVSYAKCLRAAGISVPMRVGIAGPADAETLLRFGDELGVGRSKQAMRELAASPTERQAEQTPRDLVIAIAAAQAADPSLGIEGFHFFAFGSTARTIDWAESHRT